MENRKKLYKRAANPVTPFLRSQAPSRESAGQQREDRIPPSKAEFQSARSTFDKLKNNPDLQKALSEKLNSEYLLQGAGAAGGAALGLLISGLIHSKPGWLLRLLYAAGGAFGGWFGTEALMDPASMRFNAWKEKLSEKERAAIDKAMQVAHSSGGSDPWYIQAMPQTGLQAGADALTMAAGTIIGGKAGLTNVSRPTTPPHPPKATQSGTGGTTGATGTAAPAPAAPAPAAVAKPGRVKRFFKDVGNFFNPFSSVRSRDMYLKGERPGVTRIPDQVTPERLKAQRWRKGVRGGVGMGIGLLVSTLLAAGGNYVANANKENELSNDL